MQKIFRSLHTKFGTPFKLGVLFVLIIIGLQFISPVAFIITPNAQAQDSGMIMIIALLMQMMMQLFQSSNTPQKGNVEEQLPRYATVQPTNSPTTPKTTLCDQTFFLAGTGKDLTLKPDSLKVAQNDCLNLINGSSSDKTMRIYKDDAKTATEQVVKKEDMFIFRFVNSGIFKFCVKGTGSVADFCGTTVTVGGN
ncbi:MAG: hypothetical protein Q7S57_06220 [bacterium]|nr:hypothetical protein [bacterium]